MIKNLSYKSLLTPPTRIPLLEPASRFHTAIYAVLFSVVTICGAIQVADLMSPLLYPDRPGFPVMLAAIVTGVLAPPASFVLGFYSFKLISIQERLHLLATTDPLTGLLNRRALENKFADDIEIAATSNTKLSLILVDLDHFKQVNNRYGHLGGDAMLCAIADEFRNVLSDDDAYISRWGGEEFAVVLPKTGLKKATRVGRVLRTKIEELRVDYGDGQLRATASVGVIECTLRESLEDAIDRADRCLRKAKANGRNKVVVFPTANTPKRPEQPAVSTRVQPTTAQA